jgi:heat shock protein HspQ
LLRGARNDSREAGGLERIRPFSSVSGCGAPTLARGTILDYLGIMKTRTAKFKIGQVVRHRLFPFRGVIFDIDPTFDNTEEWWLSIPEEVRPRKDQPFYHLLAENAETEYVAYVSEQNLLPDVSGDPLRHPQVSEIFEQDNDGAYRPRHSVLN